MTTLRMLLFSFVVLQMAFSSGEAAGIPPLLTDKMSKDSKEADRCLNDLIECKKLTLGYIYLNPMKIHNTNHIITQYDCECINKLMRCIKNLQSYSYDSVKNRYDEMTGTKCIRRLPCNSCREQQFEIVEAPFYSEVELALYRQSE